MLTQAAAGGGGVWEAIGSIGAAGLSALGVVLAGIVAARASASTAQTANEATRVTDDCEALVRALARAYDEMRVWARNPVGDPPEPNERVRRFYETGL